MKKSEVIDIIESCYLPIESFEQTYIPATQSISELTHLAALNMYERIKLSILAAEDSDNESEESE